MEGEGGRKEVGDRGSGSGSRRRRGRWWWYLLVKIEEEEEEVVFSRENRGGSAQHATRATPTRSSHGPMRA